MRKVYSCHSRKLETIARGTMDFSVFATSLLCHQMIQRVLCFEGASFFFSPLQLLWPHYLPPEFESLLCDLAEILSV